MTSNLVTTTPTRFSVIRPELLPPMQVLESIDSDAIIAARMTKFKELWDANDPPNAATYDVGGLEFDPIRINQELGAFFETLVRDRVNQAARAVTLAFAVGSDLDAIASRYPYGIPRLAVEQDDAYRQRIWLSPNILSLGGPGQGTFESYAFWALSAPMPVGQTRIKHATAMTRRATGFAIIAILPDSAMSTTWVQEPSDQNTWTLTPGLAPLPTREQISAVYEYVTQADAARQGLTDIVSVIAPKVTPVEIEAKIWLFPGVDKDTLMGEVRDAITALIKALYWLGADLTDLALKGALAEVGVYRVEVTSPIGDVIVPIDGVVNVTSATVTYMGTGE